MNRYNIDVKYKTYVTTSISLNADDEEDAVKTLLESLNTEAVEDFEVVGVTQIGETTTVMAPSTGTAQ